MSDKRFSLVVAVASVMLAALMTVYLVNHRNDESAIPSSVVPKWTAPLPSVTVPLRVVPVPMVESRHGHGINCADLKPDYCNGVHP